MTVREFLYGILLLTWLFFIAGTTADPDLWGHVRFGQDMLTAGSVRLPDTYSFTTNQPWVNHEWVAEIAMAEAFDRFGSAGLNALRLTVVAGTVAIIWFAMSGVHARRRMVLAGMAVLGIYWRVLPIRPQLFSVLLFAVLLFLISRAEVKQSVRPLILVPAMMAIWVNCHGGWVVGLGVFGLWCAMTILRAPARQRAAVAGIGLAAVAATALNPYGVGMWKFAASTVHIDRPMISDWQPLYTMPVLTWVPWLAGLTMFVFALRKSARVSGNVRLGIIAALLAVFSLRVSRLDAFFSLAAIFFAARTLIDSDQSAPDTATPPRRHLALASCFVVCALAFGIASARRATAIPVPPGDVPDKQVASYLQTAHLTGRMLTWFDWGEYAIWHFGPRLQVSIDGRRETVYGDEVFDAHVRLYRDAPGSLEYVATLNPDYVWLPKRLPVIHDLRANGWHPLCEGSSSILLTRRVAAGSCAPVVRTTPARFPEL